MHLCLMQKYFRSDPKFGAHAGNRGEDAENELSGSFRLLIQRLIEHLHVWDSVTPAEELLETLAQLIRAGKVRHWGLSNCPAWFVSKVAILAAASGRPAPFALQYF